MDHNNPADFDFETWERLAKEDPERFEAKRLEVIECLIASAPASKQQRLRGLQWQIDQTRARTKNALAACTRISALMWETVAGKDGLLDSLASLSDAATATPRAEKTPATVLPFKRREEEAGD